MAKTFAERTAYLQNEAWKSKPRLPFEGNTNNLTHLEGEDSEIIYDFESQSNIYSVAALYKDEGRLVIYYMVNEEDQDLVDEKAIIKKAHEINDLTIQAYPKILGNDIKLEIQKITPSMFRQIFENPKKYVIGFNSNHYDLPLASYILAYLYQNYPNMPRPEGVRLMSNLLINPIKVMNQEAYGMGIKTFLRSKGVNIYKNSIPLYQIASIFDHKPYHYDSNIKNTLFNTAPKIYEVFKRLNNTGLHLDMRLLNEKDKDGKNSVGSRYTSLKRIAAQLGFQIEEPESVDLSSEKPLDKDAITNLLAYNASDVLVTTLTFYDKTYQDPLSTRENLINRFDKDRFKGQLNINSTSAKSVENVIAPTQNDKLVDQDTINFFYPIHGKKYDKLQKEIDKDYVNQYVPYVPLKDKKDKFQAWMMQTFPSLFTQETQDNQKAQQEFFNVKKQTNDAQLINQALIKTNNEINNVQARFQRKINTYWGQIQTKKKYYDQFNQWYFDNFTNGHPDRDYLDEKWTKKLQTMKDYAPCDGFAHDGTPIKIQRFRVKYGEIQEDLLEHARLNFPKFPKEVYNMYSYYRNAKSREEATQAFVEHYIPKYGYEPLTSNDKKENKKPKPIAPPHIWYKFRKDNSVSGINAIVTVKDRPMCLSFSAGGVHGEVINDKMYQRDRKIINKFNDTLAKIKEMYPDATDFYTDALNYDMKLYFLKLNKDKKQLIKDLTLFITKKSTGKYVYKKPKKRCNPKDYVIPIDMHHAIHIDVDSLYPSMMINLHLFSKWTAEYNDPKDFNETNKTGHWSDIYAKLRAERVKLKKAAASVPKEDWRPKQYHQWAIQLINKLLLNSASGIADGKWDTKVRVNNKAASMRFMGQFALTYLVYSVEPKGFYSTSTNTDGVYLTNDDKTKTEKDIAKEIEHWKVRHHLGATPEIMEHFISKDANNRFEQENLEEPGAPAGGTIGNAFGASAKAKMSQPFVIDAGIVAYFKTHKNICKTKPEDIDINSILDYLKRQQEIIINAKEYNDTVRKAMLSFCWPIQPQKSQHFVLKTQNSILSSYLPMQHVNRLILVKKGYKLQGFELKKRGKEASKNDALTNWCINNGLIDENDLTINAYNIKISNFNPNWNVLRVNLDLKAYFKSPIWANLDLEAYAKFTKSRITGTPKHEIWIEPEFDELGIAQKVKNLID